MFPVSIHILLESLGGRQSRQQFDQRLNFFSSQKTILDLFTGSNADDDNDSVVPVISIIIIDRIAIRIVFYTSCCRTRKVFNFDVLKTIEVPVKSG